MLFSQRARAILLTDAHTLVLIRRVKPGYRRPYWTTPGSGLEESDPDLDAALRREVAEELGRRLRSSSCCSSWSDRLAMA